MSEETLGSLQEAAAMRVLAASQWLGICVDDDPFTVKRLDEVDGDARPYARASNYAPVVADLVMMRRVSYPSGPWYAAYAIEAAS
jgi:hypothetical protein